MKAYPWRDLKALIEEKGMKNDRKSFMFFQDRIVSYREMHESSNTIAYNLRKLGIKKGDNVLVFLFNSPEFILIWFALAKIGAVMVPLNTALRRLDLAYIIEDSEADTIILERDLLKSYQEVRDQFNLQREILIAENPSDTPEDMIPFKSLMDGTAANLDTEIHMSDPLCIIYTSGTTGTPKGVVLPHFSYVNSGLAIVEYQGIKPGDRLFTTLPLFHVGAQLVIVIPAMVGDIDFAMMTRFSASQFWDQVRRYNCNIVHYLGSLAHILYSQKERPDDADNPAERMVGGGATRELWEKFEKRFGVIFQEGYGLTESGTISTYNPQGKIKVGSIGLPVPHQRIEIVNENDEILPPYTHGELVIRPEVPYSMMLEYYKKPEATVEAWRNLWFHTGDIAYKDEEGYLYYVGRKSYFMRRRGENVSVEEVESVLNSHPDVKESAVVGVPSEMGEDDIKACIVPKLAGSIVPEDIIRWCEERIAYFKIPRYVEFVNQLPMTATSKIERHKLKEIGTVNIWDREKSGYRLKKH